MGGGVGWGVVALPSIIQCLRGVIGYREQRSILPEPQHTIRKSCRGKRNKPVFIEMYVLKRLKEPEFVLSCTTPKKNVRWNSALAQYRTTRRRQHGQSYTVI